MTRNRVLPYDQALRTNSYKTRTVKTEQTTNAISAKKQQQWATWLSGARKSQITA